MVYDPDEICRKIELLRKQIQELLWLPVLNPDGEIVSFADLEVNR